MLHFPWVVIMKFSQRRIHKFMLKKKQGKHIGHKAPYKKYNWKNIYCANGLQSGSLSPRDGLVEWMGSEISSNTSRESKLFIVVVALV